MSVVSLCFVLLMWGSGFPCMQQNRQTRLGDLYMSTSSCSFLVFSTASVPAVEKAWLGSLAYALSRILVTWVYWHAWKWNSSHVWSHWLLCLYWRKSHSRPPAWSYSQADHSNYADVSTVLERKRSTTPMDLPCLHRGNPWPRSV